MLWIRGQDHYCNHSCTWKRTWFFFLRCASIFFTNEEYNKTQIYHIFGKLQKMTSTISIMHLPSSIIYHWILTEKELSQLLTFTAKYQAWRRFGCLCPASYTQVFEPYISYHFLKVVVFTHATRMPQRAEACCKSPKPWTSSGDHRFLLYTPNTYELIWPSASWINSCQSCA